MSVVLFPRSRIVRHRGGIDARQRKCLNFIGVYQAENGGQYPEFDAIAAHLGLKSRGGAVRVFNQLWRAGLLDRPASLATPLPGRGR